VNYPSIRIEGSILSPDILDKLDDAAGQRPADFGMEPTAKVKDEIARAWADAQDYWRIYNRKLETLKDNSPATTETRNLWIVPLMGLLGYQLEYEAKSIELNGKFYPISHRITNRGGAAIQIIGCRESTGLDRKPEKAAIRMSAHAMMQEYLNLNEQLYGIVTNGRLLRLLRDSSRLVKLTYVEFDLDRIFCDGLFADFAILYRLLHFTRLPAQLDNSAACLLEQYHQETIEQGSRIREGLRIAVTEALQTLGTGFLEHPENQELRQQVAAGQIPPDIYFSHLLRLIYRLLFLMVIEERGLVFPKGTPAKNSTIYFQHYSVQRLRRLATTRGLQTTRHHDAWLQLLATFYLFENKSGAGVLGTTVLGGQLFSPASLGSLPTYILSNASLFVTLEKLCYFTHPQNGQRMPVNFGALATEEFGSVYESLLELHPVIEIEPMPYFSIVQAAGNERKTSGSYYTPACLVDCLLDSALDPILDEVEKCATPQQSMLGIKICDPACGSGHFLIAAAQRISRRLARLRAGNEEPSPELLHHTLREVIGHCIYGVDINPMSVELCKVGLWLEAVEPGKPLTFLDHHIKCGNSLLGATQAVIKAGIPDKAYEPIADDSNEAAKWMKKINQKDRAGQTRFNFDTAQPWERLGNLPAAIVKLEELEDDTTELLIAKEEHYRQIVESSGYDNARLLHDAWCAAFVWPKVSTDYGTELTTEHLRKIERNPFSVSPHLKEQIRALARQYRFFHWHLEFPAVFGSDGQGGFDCILGNPPWDMQEVKDNEFFALSYPEILAVKSAKDKSKILKKIKDNNPLLWLQYEEYVRITYGQKHFMLDSGRYPLSAVGRLNLYRVILEISHTVINRRGRVGLVIPSGFASDSFSQNHFTFLHQNGRIPSLYDFENSTGLFPGIDRRTRFCLITVTGPEASTQTTDFVFFAHGVEDLSEPGRHIFMSSEDLRQLNPLTGTAPLFRSEKDRSISIALHRNRPILTDESETGWQIKSILMFMVNASMTHHKTAEELESMEYLRVGNHFIGDDGEWLPLYEGKMVGAFDHRAASIRFDPTNRVRRNQPEPLSAADHDSPTLMAQPLFWVSRKNFLDRCCKVPSYCLVVKDVTSSTNERTSIAAILPPAALTDSVPWLSNPHNARVNACLCGILNSFCFDFAARQKVAGLHLRGHYLAQLPLIPLETLNSDCYWQPDLQIKDWLGLRILELSYTAWDLEDFAKDCGFKCPPFRWDETRRFQLRCELDAAFFNLYGVSRDDVDYIMETFPIVKRKDEAQFGRYRTKETILALYDAFADAQRTCNHFVSTLDPPPADPRCCHPAIESGIKLLAQTNFELLPDAAWARPLTDQSVEMGAILAAVLKAVGGPTPSRYVRLTALLAAEPRLLTSALTGEESILWKRLIGQEAEPLANGVTSLVPKADRAWGNAVQHLRSSGLLVEDLSASTWAPGTGLDVIETEGWPDGRAQMVLSILSKRSTDELVVQLPQDIQRWVYGQAA